jgi:S1-C subfamily serine protease
LGATFSVLLCGVQSAAAKPGYLGVQMQELNDALLEALDLGEGVQGVLVADVIEGSAADAAGLSRGDVIIQVDGKDVASVGDVQRRVRAFDSGEKVELAVVRDGKKRSFEVTLGETQGQERRLNRGVFELGDRPGSGMMMLSMRPLLGVELRELDADLGGYFGADKGLLVLEVREDSAAEAAGLRAGDVIVAADGQKTEEVADLHAVLEDKEDGDELKLEVLREHKQTELTATVEASDTLGFGRRFHVDGNGGAGLWRSRAPRVFMHDSNQDELREELDLLRKEVEELRSALEKERKG